MAQPQDVHVIDLDDRPAGYQLGGKSDENILRLWRLRELEALLDYHGLGFAWDDPPWEWRRQDYLEALKRIYYAKYGDPADPADVVLDAVGPVGPGTIPPATRQRLNISDHYLDEASARTLLNPAAHLRDPTALKPKKLTKNTHLINKNPSAPIHWLHADIQPPGAALPVATASIGTQVDVDPVDDPAPEDEAAGASDDGIRDETVDQPSPAQGQTGEGNEAQPTPPAVRGPSETSIVRIITGVFEHIARGLGGYRIGKVFGPRGIARNAEESRRQLVVTANACTAVSLTVDHNRWTYEISHSGQIYDLLGRGPVYSNHSGAWDSLVVAMSLLAVNGYYDHLGARLRMGGDIGDDFFRLPLDNWTAMEDYQSTRKMDDFIRRYTAHYNNTQRFPWHQVQLQRGNIDSATLHEVWEELAGPRDVFNGTRRRVVDECPCRSTPQQPGYANGLPFNAARITPRDRGLGYTEEFQEQIQSCFRRVERCRHCGQGERIERSVVQDDLKKFLVLSLDKNARPRNHTRAFDIEYDCEVPNGTRGDQGSSIVHRTARYRWAGGIYSRHTRDNNAGAVSHYTVFWRDGTPGQEESNRFVHYNGKMASAAIVGGLDVPGRDPADRIPPMWMEKPPPLLFYERVEEPTEEPTVSAAEDVRLGRFVNNIRDQFYQRNQSWPIVGGFSAARHLNRSETLGSDTQFQELRGSHPRSPILTRGARAPSPSPSVPGEDETRQTDPPAPISAAATPTRNQQAANPTAVPILEAEPENPPAASGNPPPPPEDPSTASDDPLTALENSLAEFDNPTPEDEDLPQGHDAAASSELDLDLNPVDDDEIRSTAADIEAPSMAGPINPSTTHDRTLTTPDREMTPSSVSTESEEQFVLGATPSPQQATHYNQASDIHNRYLAFLAQRRSEAAPATPAEKLAEAREQLKRLGKRPFDPESESEANPKRPRIVGYDPKEPARGLPLD